MATAIDRIQYEKDLKERQRKHLENVQKNKNNRNINWKPCLHDQCTSCHGTGKKINGEACIHWISCTCPKCTPT